MRASSKSSTTFRRSGSEVSTPISSLTEVPQLVWVEECKDDERLFLGFDTVFLWRYEVE